MTTPRGACSTYDLNFASLRRSDSSAFFLSVMSRVVERMHFSPFTRITRADISPVRMLPSFIRKVASKSETSPLSRSSRTRRSLSLMSVQMFNSTEVFPTTSSAVYPVIEVKPWFTSRYKPSDNRLMFNASGEIRNAVENFCWDERSVSSACVRSEMSRLTAT